MSFFFFKQKTAYEMRIRDRSSDVCSSDLVGALQTGLGPAWNDTLVIVATEFGRTVEVNGTGGTDHGTASTAMLLGGGLAMGGKVSADWPGLGAAARYEGRDLKPTRSLESVIARDRKSVVSGKRVSVRVDLGGRRIIKKKKRQ